jgi:tetratricopeptide (TPR) repeat protein
MLKRQIRFKFTFLSYPLMLFLITLVGCLPVARAQGEPFGKQPNQPGDSGRGPTGSASVSVHELQIPEKARREFDKGVQRVNAKDPAGSLRFFNKAIQEFPRFYEAYYNLGLAEIRLGQPDKASRWFQSAIDLSGGRLQLAEFAYGLLLCQQGNIEDAERVVRHGLDQDKTSAEGHVALGVVMLYRHRPDDAEHEAREALLRNARVPNAYLVLAEAHGELKNYSAEVQDLPAYLHLEPTGPHSEYARNLLGTTQQIAAETSTQHRQ